MSGWNNDGWDTQATNGDANSGYHATNHDEAGGAGWDNKPSTNDAVAVPADGWGTGAVGNENAAPAADQPVETRQHNFVGTEGPTNADVGNRKWLADRNRWEEGVANAELERELYEENRVNTGINFDQLDEVEVKIKGENKPNLISSFDEVDLHPGLKHNIVNFMRFKKPTPIQQAAIPVLLAGRDLMATAQTGSGKTASYLIPIMNKFLTKGKAKFNGEGERPSFFKRQAEPLALIIAPTRELACQIFDECRKFAYRSWVRPAVVYGGADTRVLLGELEKGCDILVGTPGKLRDFLNRGKVSLKRIKFLVIDEADRLFDQGFHPEVLRIAKGYDMPTDESKQVALFSATFGKIVRRLAAEYLGDTLLVTVGRVGAVPRDIIQRIEQVEDGDKRAMLLDLLYSQEAGLTLIFVNTYRAADTLDDFLHRSGFPVTSIHGARNQAEREDAISAFRSQKTPIMIGTDVAARGLDIPNIVHVINFDMPKTIEDYVHRIGRTARVGNKGVATSFFNSGNADIAPALIEELIKDGQTVPEFLEQYRNQYGGEQEENEHAGEDELNEEDLEGDLPEGYAPLGQTPAVSSTDMDGGNAWGGDTWGAGGDAAAAEPSGTDAWATGANDAGDNAGEAGEGTWNDGAQPAQENGGNWDDGAEPPQDNGNDWNAGGGGGW